MLISIVSFVVVFTLVALSHEIGHLVWAKRQGIRVHEIALGFGPRLFSVTKNNTAYSLNLIPILGYVKIAGEGEEDELDKACPKEELFYSKSPIQRIKALAAGPLMNIVLSFVLLALLFSFIGVPKGISTEVGSVSKNSPAERAGLKTGDRLVFINGKPVLKMEEAIDLIHKSPDKIVTLGIERNGQKLSIKATPKLNPKLKIGLLGFSPKTTYEKVNPFLAIYYGAEQSLQLVLVTLVVVGQLITGAVSIMDLAGPVGIAQVTGKYAQSGMVSLIQLTALISVNIGVLNLLPLPALDGGHILFALIEWVRRKPINREIENKINQWGFIALLTLMGLITINDLFRLFSK